MPKPASVTMTVGLGILLAACCIGRHRGPTTETITLAGPGFTPDPTCTSGQAGGNLTASSLATADVDGNGCIGSIPSMPQHVVHLGAALPLFRVLVSGSEDTTLLVRAPDGRVFCNDDSGDPNVGVNPLVEIHAAPPGDYSVYVGAYGDAAMLSTYSIGFTTTPGTFPSQVVR